MANERWPKQVKNSDAILNFPQSNFVLTRDPGLNRRAARPNLAGAARVVNAPPLADRGGHIEHTICDAN
jgi:hypothetical protein